MFKRVTANREITIDIPKSTSFLIIAGRSVDNAGRNIYAGASNSNGIYTFWKITGLDNDLSDSKDINTITLSANSWIEAVYVFV